MGLAWSDKKPPDVIEVPKYVEVPDYIDVYPVILECTGFDFDPDVGGMSGDEFFHYTARLYQWASACSNAQAQVRQE